MSTEPIGSTNTIVEIDDVEADEIPTEAHIRVMADGALEIRIHEREITIRITPDDTGYIARCYGSATGKDT